MYRLLALIALLTLASCGATTPTPAPLAKPRISETLQAPCAPLPPLQVAAGEKDMRPALLENRAESEMVHAECTAKHQAVLRAVGATVPERKAARRAALKAQTTPTEEPK